MNPSLLGLQSAFQDPRNVNLHPAFRAQGEAPYMMPSVVVPQGHTGFDPMLGTGWGEWLDAVGASSPQGAHLAGSSLPASPAPTASPMQTYAGGHMLPMQGLMDAAPAPQDRLRRERLAHLQNTDQKTGMGTDRAALYPNATNFPSI